MEPGSVRAAVEREHADRLADLDSPDLPAALTGGDPTPRALLEVAANSEHAARRTFREWAESAADPRTREAFAALADQEARHYDLLRPHLPGGFEPVDGGMLHAYLRGREDPAARVGAGMVGRPLYTFRAHGRIRAVLAERGEADAAAVVGRLRSDTADVLDRGGELLADLCAEEADRTRARSAAGYVLRVAHDDVREGLAEAGDPPGRDPESR